jgi:TolB protein
MTVSAPPRPPSPARAPDNKPLEREEIEALVEALIEEARGETRRRRRRYWALVVLVTFVGVVVFTLLQGGAASQTASPALSARSGAAAAGTPRSKIAFVGSVGGFMGPAWSQLYVMKPDGSGKRRLARRFWVSRLGSLVWSPDRRKLVFSAHVSRSAACDGAGSCKPEIFVINADGSGLRQLTRNAVVDREPAWSPDGQKIAFESWRDGADANIYVMNADGSDQQNLTPKPGDQGGPRWSPDGRAILFTAVPPGPPRSGSPWPFRGDVDVMNADGSGQRNLTHTGESGEFDPSWSPDGRNITFSRLAGPPWGVRIIVMNADGRGKRAVTPKFARSGDRGLTGTSSPDGRRIAFDEDDAIYVINTDGSGLRRLAQNASFGDWSPDGRKIIFARRSYPKKSRPATAAQAARWAETDLWVMNADGSGQRNLTRTPTTADGWGATWAR